jgi:hypothetical protein
VPNKRAGSNPAPGTTVAMGDKAVFVEWAVSRRGHPIFLLIDQNLLHLVQSLIDGDAADYQDEEG